MRGNFFLTCMVLIYLILELCLGRCGFGAGEKRFCWSCRALAGKVWVCRQYFVRESMGLVQLRSDLPNFMYETHMAIFDHSLLSRKFY